MLFSEAVYHWHRPTYSIKTHHPKNKYIHTYSIHLYYVRTCIQKPRNYRYHTNFYSTLALLNAPYPLYTSHCSLSLSIQPSSLVRESASLSAVLATASGFVLEALEKRSLTLATSLLTQMVYIELTLHISNTHYSQSICEVFLAISYIQLTVFSCAYCTRVVVLCSIYLVYGCAVFTEVRLLPHHQQTTQRLSGEPRLMCVRITVCV